MVSKIQSRSGYSIYVQQVTAFRLILSIKRITNLTFFFHTHLHRLLRHIQKWNNVFLFAKVMFKEFLDIIIPAPPPLPSLVYLKPVAKIDLHFRTVNIKWRVMYAEWALAACLCFLSALACLQPVITVKAPRAPYQNLHTQPDT